MSWFSRAANVFRSSDVNRILDEEITFHIESRIDELDHATHDWAGRRMNRAVQAAIEGRSVSEIAKSVEHAAGVDAHVLAHEQGRG